MSGWTRGWAVALRIARREARRHRGRTVLVVLLIAFPIAALSMVATTWDMFRLLPAESLARSIGSADAAVQQHSAGPITQSARGNMGSGSGPFIDVGVTETYKALEGYLPAGTRVTTFEKLNVDLRTATGTGTLEAYQADLASPILRGLLNLVKGRAPSSDDEVAVNAAARKRLGAGIGATISLADDSRKYRVVGIFDNPGRLTEAITFTHTGLPDSAAGYVFDKQVLLDTPQPVSWTQVRSWNEHGFLVISRQVWLHPPTASVALTDPAVAEVNRRSLLMLASVVIAVGTLEVVLLAGPAFTVGARRRRRELAVLAAAGAPPAQLRRVVLADGVTAGLLAAGLGCLIGIGAAFLARSPLEDHIARSRAAAYRVPPLILLAVVAVALLVGLGAALVPAVSAARQDVTAALAGRMPLARIRRRWVLLGMIVVGVGAATGLASSLTISPELAVVGVVATEFGILLCTPALVNLVAKLGRWLPAIPRITLRDAARNRAAATSAIAAVMAAVAGTVAIGIYSEARSQVYRSDYSPVLPSGSAAATLVGSRTVPLPADAVAQLTTAAHTLLKAQQVVELRSVGCPSGSTLISCQLQLAQGRIRDCPYMTTTQPLSVAQRRAAARDPRCATYALWFSTSPLGTVVDDGSNLAALTGASGADLERGKAMLQGGGMVLVQDGFITSGTATMEKYLRSDRQQGEAAPAADGTGQNQATKYQFPAYRLTTAAQRSSLMVLSPQAVAQAGLETRVVGIVAATKSPPTSADEDRFNARVREINGLLPASGSFSNKSTQLAVAVERGPSGSSTGVFLLIITIAAGVITIGAAAIATGLASADRRPDLVTLGALGASPATRRRLAASQSGLIAGLGSMLGTLSGLGIAVVVLTSLNRASEASWPLPTHHYQFLVPWRFFWVPLLLVPVIATVGSGVASRSRLPVETRRSG